MTTFIPGPCECEISGFGSSTKIHYCTQHRLTEEARGDALVLQSWMKENGCTPSMKSSECDSLKNDKKVLQQRIVELEWRIQALEKHINQSETVPRPGTLEYEIEQSKRQQPYRGYKP